MAVMAAVNCKCCAFSDHVVRFFCPASSSLPFGFREFIPSLLSCVLISLTLLLLPPVLDQSCPIQVQLGAVEEKARGGCDTDSHLHALCICKYLLCCAVLCYAFLRIKLTECNSHRLWEDYSK